MAPRKASPPERVGALVPSVLRDLGLDESARALRILEGWPGAVGAEVASHARPIALRNGALEVAVDSSAWCQTLRLRAPQLLDALSGALGGDAPASLWFRLAGPDGILRE
jgi:predicted nucleic acid-binding Zn ribbon protein